MTVEKGDNKQVQFTGGSPLEETHQQVVYKIGREVKFYLSKVEENAIARTKNRTGVEVIDHYNETPLVDWALMESTDDEGNSYWKLVCLLHYIVKKSSGRLKAQKGMENVTEGGRYDVDAILS